MGWRLVWGGKLKTNVFQSKTRPNRMILFYFCSCLAIVHNPATPWDRPKAWRCCAARRHRPLTRCQCRAKRKTAKICQRLVRRRRHRGSRVGDRIYSRRLHRKRKIKKRVKRIKPRTAMAAVNWAAVEPFPLSKVTCTRDRIMRLTKIGRRSTSLWAMMANSPITRVFTWVHSLNYIVVFVCLTGLLLVRFLGDCFS